MHYESIVMIRSIDHDNTFLYRCIFFRFFFSNMYSGRIHWPFRGTSSSRWNPIDNYCTLIFFSRPKANNDLTHIIVPNCYFDTISSRNTKHVPTFICFRFVIYSKYFNEKRVIDFYQTIIGYLHNSVIFLVYFENYRITIIHILFFSLRTH